MSDRQKFLGIELPHVPDKIEPEKFLGYERLTDNEKFLAERISVLDQRTILSIRQSNASIAISVLVGKIVGICILAFLLLEGPRLHRIWSEYLGVKVERDSSAQYDGR